MEPRTVHCSLSSFSRYLFPLQLTAGAQTTIGLRFTSGIAHPGKYPVHIFINDEDDKNEETFLVNVTYV